jgi:hypothetical protein
VLFGLRPPAWVRGGDLASLEKSLRKLFSRGQPLHIV